MILYLLRLDKTAFPYVDRPISRRLRKSHPRSRIKLFVFLTVKLKEVRRPRLCVLFLYLENPTKLC